MFTDLKSAQVRVRKEKKNDKSISMSPTRFDGVALDKKQQSL